MAATKGKKNAKVKWAIGGSEPDDLPDFQSNDDILRKNKGALPAKGRTRILVKKVTSKENKNGDQMLTVTCEIAEGTAKKPGSHDGYAMWERLNVTEQGAPFLKRFLTAIGVTWNDFVTKTVADDTETPMVINKIGNVKFGDKPVVAFASIKHAVDQNDEQVAEIGRFMPPPEDEDEDTDESEDDEDDEDIDVEDDDDDDDDSDDEDDADDDDSDEEDDDADDEDDDDEDDEEDEDDDSEAELREELAGLKVVALKKRAIRAGADEDDMPGKKPALIDLIVELELGDEDEEEDGDDDDSDDESAEDAEARIREELAELDLKGLRDRARLNGRKATDLKGAKKPALIKFILEDEIPPF